MSPKTKDAQDLEILQREYRNMEVNRRTFAEESQMVLRKQHQTLEKLRKENETLRTDVATLQTKSSLRPVNSFEKDLMDRCYTDIEKYTMLTENEKSRISTMEEQISALRTNTWKKYRTMGGANAARENQRLVEKQVRILENRLDQALVKFNKSLAHNRKLRQEIDGLRGERAAFEAFYNKLEKELKEKKKQMAQVIEQSNLAYEQRDKDQLEITAIEQVNQKEQETFEQQMKELSKILEEECAKLLNKRKPLKPCNSEMNMSERERIEKRRATLKENATSREKVQLKERMQNFEEAFRKIAAATGISDVEELVRTFIANEEQNFSLFTYANEQANEIKKLEGQIQTLHDEEAKYAQENGDDANQYERILQELNDKLQSSKSQIDKLELKCNESQKSLDELKFEIETLLIQLECKNDIPGGPSVTELNMLHFLGILEQRANEVLSVYHNMKSNEPQWAATKPGSTTPSILGVGPSVPMGGEPIFINPPKLADYSSDDASGEEGDAARPLTREELKTKAENRCYRRRGRGETPNSKKGRRGSSVGPGVDGRPLSTDSGVLNRSC